VLHGGGLADSACDPYPVVRWVFNGPEGHGDPGSRSHDHDIPMGWATRHIAKLQSGQTVSFRPTGNSMKPKIESGQLCTVDPVTDVAVLAVGDIVLCKVRGNEYLHLIKAIQDQRFLIGNNRGGTNGWIGPHSIFGRLVRVE